MANSGMGKLFHKGSAPMRKMRFEGGALVAYRRFR